MNAAREATPDDAEALCQLRCALWPSGSAEEHARDLQDFFSGRAREPLQILVAATSDGLLTGFCEFSIRAYAEGCASDRVGYLEGWYVSPDARQQGVGRVLVAAGEQWAREQGRTEFAFDAAVDNRVSAAAHGALGFSEASLVRCFRKGL